MRYLALVAMVSILAGCCGARIESMTAADGVQDEYQQSNVVETGKLQREALVASSLS